MSLLPSSKRYTHFVPTAVVAMPCLPPGLCCEPSVYCRRPRKLRPGGALEHARQPGGGGPDVVVAGGGYAAAAGLARERQPVQQHRITAPQHCPDASLGLLVGADPDFPDDILQDRVTATGR